MELIITTGPAANLITAWHCILLYMIALHCPVACCILLYCFLLCLP